MTDAPVIRTPYLSETRELLRRGDISACGHVESVLATIRRRDPALGAFVIVAGDDALRSAERADTLIRERGADAWLNQPLLGVPIAVKDLIQTADLPTTRGSLIENRRPRVDAPAVRRLRSAGAIVVGKTATSEYGWSASTVSRIAGPTRNPWAPELSSGGSSGGSAAAVAARLCPVALGTDGAGSVRIPAAFCGVVGFKPSFGRVPYVPPGADRLSHVGPFATNVRDVAEVMAVLAGPHPADPESSCGPQPVAREPRALRIAWLEFPGTSDAVHTLSRGVCPVLTALGHTVEEIGLPFRDPYPALIDILAANEAAGSRPDDERWSDPGRLAIADYGRSVSGASLVRAEDERLALRITLATVMEQYDLLAMATVPIEPFAAGVIGPDWAADPADLQWLAWSPASYPFNLTGQPAVSLPVGRTGSGLPVGVQLVGAVGDDDLVLAVAGSVEAEIGILPPPSPSAPVDPVSR